MSISFSHSMQSHQADHGRFSLIWVGLAIIFLLLWSVWFFWAPITRYETGFLVETRQDGTVIAEFPSQALESIWQGQSAHIRPKGIIARQVGSIPAVVLNILGSAANDTFLVSLAVEMNPQVVDALEESLSGEVEVEVEQVSPATLVARASGQFLDTPSVSLSPQK